MDLNTNDFNEYIKNDMEGGKDEPDIINSDNN